MDIQKYFEYYALVKKKPQKIKTFGLSSKQTTLLRYFRKNKNYIIKSINYAFFESKEPYILSVFSSDDVKYIHVNGRLTKEFPKSMFETHSEYENFLAIYGTMALLLDENFQITTIKDNKIIARELITDLAHRIYRNKEFNLNLEHYTSGNNDEYLKYVYRYGYDFLLYAFTHIMKCKQTSYDFSKLKTCLKIDDEDLRKLFKSYETKILFETL